MSIASTLSSVHRHRREQERAKRLNLAIKIAQLRKLLRGEHVEGYRLEESEREPAQKLLRQLLRLLWHTRGKFPRAGE